jgi:hypothetical protein
MPGQKARSAVLRPEDPGIHDALPRLDRHQCGGLSAFIDMNGMKVLFIINDPPYGTERVYNALRLAHALVKKDPAAQITVFLMADAVIAGKPSRKRPRVITTSSACSSA